MLYKDNYTEITLNYPCQTWAQERKMILELKDKDPKRLKELLVLHNIGLVGYWCGKLCYDKSKKEEYMSYGMIGLMNAIRKFDLNSGYKFGNYASLAIRNSMINMSKVSKIDRRCFWMQTPIKGRDDDSDGEYNVESLIYKDIDPESLVVKQTDVVVDNDYKKNVVEGFVEEMRKAKTVSKSNFRLLFDYYGKNKSLSSMAKSLKICSETARKRVLKTRTLVLDHLRKKYNVKSNDELKKLVFKELC